MADRIEVPLDLEDFEVLDCQLVGGTLEVDVRATTPERCNHCDSVDVRPHAVTLRRIRDRACGYPTMLNWHQRRFRCAACGHTSRERHPAVAGRKAITRRFERSLFEGCVDAPFVHVAARERVSFYRVVDAFETHAPIEIVATEIPPARVLAIDESSFRKRLVYKTMLADPEHGWTIDVVDGRTKAAVASALLSLSAQVRANIDTVVMDLFWPFRKAVEEHLPRARIVVDKFHVIASIENAAQKVRRRIGALPRRDRMGPAGRLAPRQVKPANDPRVFALRWVYTKRARHLDDPQRRWLEDVFSIANPELRAAWWLKEAFASIYDAGDRCEAERRLDAWLHNMRNCGLKEFTDTWRTLSHWRDEILNYFDDPVTNAFAEGITNKIKVMKRSAYGFRNPKRYRQKILLACGPRRGKTEARPP